MSRDNNQFLLVVIEVSDPTCLGGHTARLDSQSKDRQFESGGGRDLDLDAFHKFKPSDG